MRPEGELEQKRSAEIPRGAHPAPRCVDPACFCTRSVSSLYVGAFAGEGDGHGRATAVVCAGDQRLAPAQATESHV